MTRASSSYSQRGVGDSAVPTRRFLTSSQLFRTLPSTALDDVVPRFDRVRLSGGSVLFRQGEPGDAMYLIASGRVQVVVEGDGREDVVREMGRGENLGELALLTEDPRAATIRAIRDSELLRLSSEQFQSLIQEQPAAALELTRILARWVRESNRPRPRRGIGTVAVIPETEGAPHRRLARELAGALEAHGATLLLDEDRVDLELGPGAAMTTEAGHGHGRVTEWLNECEREHQFMVYCAGNGHDTWTRRCLRQADMVIRVARPGGRVLADPVSPATVETGGSGATRQEMLVLVHPPGAIPTEAGYWLDGGRYPRHLHIREDRPEDTARLARHLAGCAVGVVLGGGGALGFAHVGVLKALREAGLQADRFGGTSIGSIIAALYASGLSDEEVQERLEAAWGRMQFRPHRTRNLPLYGLDSGERVRSTFEVTFGSQRIEDLWLPFFCTTTNLTTGRPVIHRSGSLARWLNASVAIPGVVPPSVSDTGELLVDGALLNNLPSNIMAGEGQGPVVAVSVSTAREPRVASGRQRAPSSWEVLLGKVLPFRHPPDFPNIVQVLHRSATIGSVHARRNVETEVDLYMKPRLEQFDMFSWDRLSDIIAAGYRYAAERLEAEPDLLESVQNRGASTPAEESKE